MSNAAIESVMPADPIDRLLVEVDSARRDGDCRKCQRILANLIGAFEQDHAALDRTLFDSFGKVVQCADIAYSLVQLYLQLVTEYCSSREVMTLLMSSLDIISG